MTRLLARTALVLSLAIAGCGDDDDPPTGTGGNTTTTLTSGVAVTNISASANNNRMYKINVPAGATRLLITTSGPGGNMDVDLYVKRGTAPTTSSIDDDCDSENEFTTETCDLSNPAAGDWYIMLRAWTAYSGVTLTATVTRP